MSSFAFLVHFGFGGDGMGRNEPTGIEFSLFLGLEGVAQGLGVLLELRGFRECAEMMKKQTAGFCLVLFQARHFGDPEVIGNDLVQAGTANWFWTGARGVSQKNKRHCFGKHPWFPLTAAGLFWPFGPCSGQRNVGIHAQISQSQT